MTEPVDPGAAPPVPEPAAPAATDGDTSTTSEASAAARRRRRGSRGGRGRGRGRADGSPGQGDRSRVPDQAPASPPASASAPDDGDLPELALPFEPRALVFEGNQVTATAANHANVDIWEKVE